MMDSSLVFYSAVPKRPRAPELSRDDRFRIQVLIYEAGWTIDQIVLQYNYTEKQIRNALRLRLTPQKSKTGRKASLNTPTRKRLADWLLSSSSTRRLTLTEISAFWSYGIKAIRNALKKERIVSRFARRKPQISEANRLLRLEFAEEHRNWTREQWYSILWSDESWINPGRHKRTRIWRKIGLEEVYHPDCVEPKIQRKIGWMFWGSISGKYGKGPSVFWEKSWGSISAETYSERIVPVIGEYIQQHPELSFQQDNAGAHGAVFTKLQLAGLGIHLIDWPAFSPDLNPIETIWNWIKDYIQEQDPNYHRSYPRLRRLVIEAWNSISDDKIRELIDQMSARCEAVIAANGMYINY